jgi:UPF0716 protein FxsA
MFALFAIAFIVVPLVELYVFVQVGQSIGFLNTIGLLVLVAFVGAWLTRHEGVGVVQRIRAQMDAGRMPADDLLDGALVLAGGLLLILPGFVTDAVGLLVLFPPTRHALRSILRRRLRIVTVQRYNGPAGPDRFGRDGPDGPPVIDV